MAAEQEYATHIVDLLEGIDQCEARRMFGGYGILHQGLMFGLIADGSLYLKAGDACRRRARFASDAALRNPPKRKRSKS